MIGSEVIVGEPTISPEELAEYFQLRRNTRDGMLETISRHMQLSETEKQHAKAEKQRADNYERQLDAAADACYDALQINPNDEHLQRISRALTS